MGKIRQLSADVYEKIAAGEVVERPLSVVKELVENSLDAGADEIRIELKDGGKELIRVEDNGQGFADEDIAIAFQRHSTSKLTEIEDLDRLQTLGFRGEALPSIATVGRIELRTSARDDGRGSECLIVAGGIQSNRPIAFHRGTAIAVSQLFANFPVRRKFLKSAQTELNQIIAFVESAALANFRVSFQLRHGPRSVLDYTKSPQLADRIYQVFGKAFLDDLLEIDFSAADYRLHGYASRLGRGVTVRHRQHFIVNGRPVKEKTLFASFNNSYREFLAKGENPAGILLFQIPPADIDVNIHPMKLEIRFRDSQRIYSFLREAVISALRPDVGTEPFGPRPTGPVPAAASFSGPAPESGRPLFSPMRTDRDDWQLLGQYANSYIVIEKNGELLVIDQHNAQERVIFERLQRGLAGSGGVPVAAVLFPLVIDLSPAERASFDEKKLDWLRRVGFEIGLLSGTAIEVKSFPQALEEKSIRDTLLAVAHLPVNELDFEEKMLAEVACRSAIKVNHPLAVEQMRTIVRELLATGNPHYCPHRRPIIAAFPLAEIEKLLKRR